MDKIWLMRAVYEKNADDGVQYFFDKDKLAMAVKEAEDLGGRVQVYACVPVSHDVFVAKVTIELSDPLA